MRFLKFLKHCFLSTYEKRKPPKSFLLQNNLGGYGRKINHRLVVDREANACRPNLPGKQSVTDTQSFHNIKQNILACKKELKTFMSRLSHQIYLIQPVNVKGGVK